MMEKNESNYDSIILLLLLAGSFYYKYRGYIEERLHNPFFLVFLGCLLGLVYTVYLITGHYMEKVINRIKKWQHGIKKRPKRARDSLSVYSI